MASLSLTFKKRRRSSCSSYSPSVTGPATPTRGSRYGRNEAPAAPKKNKINRAVKTQDTPTKPRLGSAIKKKGRPKKQKIVTFQIPPEARQKFAVIVSSGEGGKALPLAQSPPNLTPLEKAFEEMGEDVVKLVGHLRAEERFEILKGMWAEHKLKLFELLEARSFNMDVLFSLAKSPFEAQHEVPLWEYTREYNKFIENLKALQLSAFDILAGSYLRHVTHGLSIDVKIGAFRAMGTASTWGPNSFEGMKVFSTKYPECTERFRDIARVQGAMAMLENKQKAGIRHSIEDQLRHIPHGDEKAEVCNEIRCCLLDEKGERPLRGYTQRVLRDQGGVLWPVLEIHIMRTKAMAFLQRNKGGDGLAVAAGEGERCTRDAQGLEEVILRAARKVAEENA
ncbi:hypothetical protein B0O99DRAFT_670229 [Bisporella sp. PMI_857]|nr:hypothetical protein B0O99DRAFT_670229 [Bisporella sp. PMI_857]